MVSAKKFAHYCWVDEVLGMLKLRKQAGIAKPIKAVKTKTDFENCIELMKSRKQGRLAKQLSELIEKLS